MFAPDTGSGADSKSVTSSHKSYFIGGGTVLFAVPAASDWVAMLFEDNNDPCAAVPVQRATPELNPRAPSAALPDHACSVDADALVNRSLIPRNAEPIEFHAAPA